MAKIDFDVLEQQIKDSLKKADLATNREFLYIATAKGFKELEDTILKENVELQEIVRNVDDTKNLEVVKSLLDNCADIGNTDDENSDYENSDDENSDYENSDDENSDDENSDVENSDDESFDSDRTPLHYACLEGDIEEVKRLLEEDQEVNIMDYNGNTPLHYVCECKCDYDYLEIARLLLDYGADMNASNEDDYTPFLLACSMDSLEMVKLLLEKDIDILPGAYTPLYVASKSVSMQVLEFLLENGFDVNEHIPYSGNTALHVSCYQAEYAVVKLLLEYDADIEATCNMGNTPLHAVCKGLTQNRLDIVKLLIDAGADIEATNNDGDIPLHSACCSGHVNIIRLFLRLGINIDIPNNSGNTPLHYASLNDNLDAFKLLLWKDANIQAINTKGDTILHNACKRGGMDMVKLLIAEGISVSIPNNNGNTPLHETCFRGYTEVVKLLLENGADINASNLAGETPLLMASSICMIKLLLREGASIEAENNKGQTLLYKTYENKNITLVNFLEERLSLDSKRLIQLKKERNIKPQLQTIIVSAELMFKKNQKNK